MLKKRKYEEGKDYNAHFGENPLERSLKKIIVPVSAKISQNGH